MSASVTSCAEPDGALPAVAGRGAVQGWRACATWLPLIGIVLILAAAPAWAQPGTATATGTGGGATYPALADLLGYTADAVQEAIDSLRGNPRIAAVGSLLSGFFLVLLLVWTGVKCMAAGRGLGELLADWVPILVSFAVVYLMLERSVGDLLVQFMDSLAAAIGGHDLSSLRQALTAGVRPMVAAAVQVLDRPSMAAGSLEGQGWMGALATGAIHWVAGTLTGAMVALLLVVAAAVMALHIIIGFVSVQLVLTLAPVMVPFLMFHPAAWVFDAWVRFLVGACMLKVVMAFVLTVSTRMLGGLEQLVRAARSQAAAAGPESPVSDLMLYLSMVLVALIATLLVSQSLPIATGLVSGSAGSAGFGGANAGTRAMSKALRQAARLAAAMGRVGMQAVHKVASHAVRPSGEGSGRRGR